jgi:hypothetical protein
LQGATPSARRLNHAFGITLSASGNRGRFNWLNFQPDVDKLLHFLYIQIMFKILFSGVTL